MRPVLLPFGSEMRALSCAQSNPSPPAAQATGVTPPGEAAPPKYASALGEHVAKKLRYLTKRIVRSALWGCFAALLLN